jgi:hypothetical protein
MEGGTRARRDEIEKEEVERQEDWFLPERE